MGKGKRRSKQKKAKPEKTGSDGRAAIVPAPRPSSGGAAEVSEGAKRAPVANRECINCDNCGAANPQKCCSRCFSYYYCSKECQRTHWKCGHKESCAILKNARGDYDVARDRSNLPGGTSAVMDGPCAICLEEEVKHPVTFECGHAFCFECVFIYQSKEMKATCPYCRGEIPDVYDKARDRYNLYVDRAIVAGEESEERKTYCHLAMAEYDALSQIEKHPQSCLIYKAQIIALSKDPEALLEVTGDILSGSQSTDWELDHEDAVETKLWRARAYSEMGKWTDASEIYSELRREDMNGPWHGFTLEIEHCRCLFELGDYHKAIVSGNRAVRMGRFRAGVHKYLALAQKAAGNIDAAKKTMSRAILYEVQWDIENKERNKQILRDL